MLEKGFNVAALRNQISNFRCQKWLCLPWKQDSNSSFMDKYMQLSLACIANFSSERRLGRSCFGRLQGDRLRLVKVKTNVADAGTRATGCCDHFRLKNMKHPLTILRMDCEQEQTFFSEWLSISHTSLAHFGCWSPTTLPTPSAQATWDGWSTRRRRGWEWGPGRCRAVGRWVSNNSGPPPDPRVEKKALGCRGQLCKYEGARSFSL